MSFLNALFLVGAVGVLGPILAHLLARPRFKRIPFTMMQFLQEGDLESQSRRKIRNLLLLLIRCMIIVCIVLGFAGPTLVKVVEKTEEKESKVYLVAVDDSLSMRYADRFSQIKKQLNKVMDEWPTESVVTIHGLASNTLVKDATVDQAKLFLDEMKTTLLPAQLDGFIQDVGNYTTMQETPKVYIASDYSPAIESNLKELIHPKSRLQVESFEALTIEDKMPLHNVSILEGSAWMGAGDSLVSSVTVMNYGTEAFEGELSAQGGEGTVVKKAVNLSPRQSKSIQVEIPYAVNENQSPTVEFSLNAEDGLAEDDRFYLGLNQPGNSGKHIVLLCNTPREAFLIETAIRTLDAMSSSDTFTVQVLSYSQFNESALNLANLVMITSVGPVLNGAGEALKRFVEQGGRLVTFLHPNQNTDSLKHLFDTGVLPALPEKENTKSTTMQASFQQSGHPLADSQTIVQSLEHYALDAHAFDRWYTCRSASDATAYWGFVDEASLIYYKAIGNGESLVINTSADDSLSNVFKSNVSLAFCNYLVGATAQLQNLANEVGQPLKVELTGDFDNSSTRLTVTTGDQSLVQARIQENAALVPGIYSLGWAHLNTSPRQSIGINPPLGDGDLWTLNKDGSMQLLSSIFEISAASVITKGNIPSEGESSHSLWAWAIGAALLLLLLDSALSNRLVR